MDTDGIENSIDSLADYIREEGKFLEEQNGEIIDSLRGIERALQSPAIIEALHGIEAALLELRRSQ